MKQTFLFLSATLFLLLFSQKSNGQCTYTLSKDTTVLDQPIEIGTTDTIGSFICKTDSCKGNTYSFSFSKSGNVPDSNLTNLKLYKNGVYLFDVPVSAGIQTIFYSTFLDTFQTTKFVLMGKIDSQSNLSDIVKYNLSLIILDSNNTPHIVPSVSQISGQTMTVSGCILSSSQNPSFGNQTITPSGSEIKIGSVIVDPIGGCSVLLNNVKLDSAGNYPNSLLTNLKLKQGTTQYGATIPVMYPGLTITINDTIATPITFDLYAIPNTTGNNGDSAKIQFEFSGTNLGNGNPVNSIITGQTTTISNISGGSCATTLNQVSTYTYIYAGNTEYLGAFELQSLNCYHTITQIKAEMIGNGLVSKCINAEVYDQNGTTFGSLIPIMNYINDFNDNYLMLPSEIDTFGIVIDVANDTDDSSTYQIQVTVTGFDENNIPFNQIIMLSEKTVIASPTAVNDVTKNGISIFPNPTTDILNVAGIEKETEIRIVDIVGKEVLKGVVSNIQNQIDVSTLPTGNYILNLYSEKNNKKIKFIKQ